MEQSDYVTDTIDVYRLLQTDFPDLRMAIQAYLRRTPVDLESLAAFKPKVRLVKGAYAEPEEIAFQKKTRDRRAVPLPHRLALRARDRPGDRDPRRRPDRARTDRRRRRIRSGQEGFEIQMLYGIRRELQETTRAAGIPRARLRPVRFGLVPVPDATDGRAPREPSLLLTRSDSRLGAK